MMYNVPLVKLSYCNDSVDELPKIRCSAQSAELFRKTFDEGEIQMQEYFKVAYLSQGNRCFGVHNVAMGGVEATHVDMKIIFTGALLSHASNIILCHNHPSGNTKPSLNDIETTNKIKEAAKLLDMNVLDHIILTKDSYYSFSDDGLLVYVPKNY